MGKGLYSCIMYFIMYLYVYLFGICTFILCTSLSLLYLYLYLCVVLVCCNCICTLMLSQFGVYSQEICALLLSHLNSLLAKAPAALGRLNQQNGDNTNHHYHQPPPSITLNVKLSATRECVKSSQVPRPSCKVNWRT